MHSLGRNETFEDSTLVEESCVVWVIVLWLLAKQQKMSFSSRYFSCMTWKEAPQNTSWMYLYFTQAPTEQLGEHGPSRLTNHLWLLGVSVMSSGFFFVPAQRTAWNRSVENQKSYHRDQVLVESLLLINSPAKLSRYIVVISLLWRPVEIFVIAPLEYRWQALMKYDVFLTPCL